MKGSTMQKRARPNKGKRGKRNDGTDAAACISASRLLYMDQIVAPTISARPPNSAPAPVCLVPSTPMAADAVLDALSKRLRMREAALGTGVSALLPASGTAVIVLHPLHATRWTDVDKVDQEVLLLLSRRGDVSAAAQRVRSVSSSNTNVLVVVLDDLDLFKYLSLACADCTNVAISPCHGVAEAESLICARAEAHALYKSSTQQHVRSAHVAQCVVPTMAAAPMEQLVWDALGVADTALVRDGDLADLLGGRISAQVCQERFGWSMQTSHALLRALQTNDAIEH